MDAAKHIIVAPRVQLHHRIRHEFGAEITQFFQRYPDQLLTGANNVTVRALLAVMERTLDAVDEFKVSECPEGVQRDDCS